MDNFDGESPDTIENSLPYRHRQKDGKSCYGRYLLRKPAVVTDTHCIRICSDLDLQKIKSLQKVEEDLRKCPERSSDFCHRLVLFGREYCKARGRLL